MAFDLQCTPQLSLEFGKTCACGCGELCVSRFVRGHNGRVQPRNGRAWASEPAELRFWRFVDKNGPLWNGTHCWLWIGANDGEWNYGTFGAPGGTTKSHIFSYKLSGKIIPKGMQLDHLCRQTRCCNPDHLEPVSNRENQARSPITPLGRLLLTGKCKKGHIQDAQTSYTRYVDGKAMYSRCRACRRIREGKSWPPLT